MAILLRKLNKALARKGQQAVRKHDHLYIIRMVDKHVLCDMDVSGMDKAMLCNNIELMLLAVTQ